MTISDHIFGNCDIARHRSALSLADMAKGAVEAKAAADSKCKEMAAEISKLRQGQAANGLGDAATGSAITGEMAAATKRIRTVKGLKEIDVDVRSGSMSAWSR